MYPDSHALAQKMYDASLTAEEVSLDKLRPMLATAWPDYDAVDNPEKYRWFLIPKFPTKEFGITLDWLMEESGQFASQEKWQHDRIIDLLASGEPAWPAFATADGVIFDGYHRIAAHGTLKHENMSVVVAVRRPSSDEQMWDEMWNHANPRLLTFSELPEQNQGEVLDHLSAKKAKKTTWKLRLVEPEFVYKQYGMPQVHMDQVKILEETIKREGFTVPITVDGIDGWMEGNHRARAALRLRMKEIPAYTRES